MQARAAPSREQFALAKTQGRDDLAGEAAVNYLQARAADLLYAQHARDRFNLVATGRADDDQFVAGSPMRFHQCDRLAVQGLRQVLAIRLLAECR